jgi:aspartate racemase
VKIRGFRIEVSEIEMALLNADTIKEAVVIAREDIPGDKRLVAYIVPNATPAPTPSELRRYLQDKVPDYMLPSGFVFLDALPLTPNGKLNRLALPAPDANNQELKATFVAPRDDLEQELLQIWQEVLGVQPIGVADNFFDLGGHSLLAVRLFAQIEKKFGKKLPLAILFQSGTVKDLAKTIREQEVLALDDQSLISDVALANDLSAARRQEKSEPLWSSLVKIKPEGTQLPLFLVHPLGGEILCYRALAQHLGPDQPVYGLQPQGLDGEQPPLTQIEDMTAHYLKEIKSIQRNGPYFLGGYSFGGIVAYEMAQQLSRQGEKVGILAMVDTNRPGTEKRSPFLMRVFAHINNFLQDGPVYLQQKLAGWREWGTYQIREKYKRLLEQSERLPEGDKHLDIISANDQAQNQYIFQVYPGQMTLLRTDDKNRDTAVGMQYDPLFGWGSLVAGGIDVHHLPGSHLSLLDEPNVQVLAEKLKLCLEKAYAMNLTQTTK